ncbi:adenosylmethionine decarboxylase [Amycolatopsis sp. NPDC051102]|uniref:adenosylmethionine decarboxylase n=1 Tax=Amycolatopsis sp. NPDC051102 TaxID=3155163 RepID=UPI0034140F00
MPDVGRFTGRHVLAELHGVDPALLDDPVRLGELLRAAVTEAGATVLDVVAQRFAPQGVTVIALLAESHASVHTYPEHGSLFADVFTCGDRADPEHALRLLAKSLHAAPVHLSVLHRGER